ncbi:MAG: transposase [Chlorobium sp.]|nr:transposase [Chlorobium sp.]
MMLATLLYDWRLGIRSSRRITNACEDQVPFRWLIGKIRSDDCAFSRFRSRHEAIIQHLSTIGMHPTSATESKYTGATRECFLFVSGITIFIHVRPGPIVTGTRSHIIS